ncbi:hypothetical protein JRQ81_010680 [Phrynocephalus forsythii]|uniref:Sushi domain-containing protein n=1 Tax=Phrynocephalus forsythii TaxID=171643 RepID=A0A9Q0X7L8_9SAUR|nr:hypothetical protein JRQ81_010680 [Phrynocephalus forsythii]
MMASPTPGSFLFPVNCGRPEAEFHSVVYGNDWWVGSVVRYNCQPGFLLVGDPASACQSNGQWTPKPTCLRICLQGRIEINERDIDGSCSSTCPNKVHLGAFLNHGCLKISSCVTKQSGWTRWFSRCDFCQCDCYVACGKVSVGKTYDVQGMVRANWDQFLQWREANTLSSYSPPRHQLAE